MVAKSIHLGAFKTSTVAVRPAAAPRGSLWLPVVFRRARWRETPYERGRPAYVFYGCQRPVPVFCVAKAEGRAWIFPPEHHLPPNVTLTTDGKHDTEDTRVSWNSHNDRYIGHVLLDIYKKALAQKRTLMTLEQLNQPVGNAAKRFRTTCEQPSIVKAILSQVLGLHAEDLMGLTILYKHSVFTGFHVSTSDMSQYSNHGFLLRSYASLARKKLPLGHGSDIIFAYLPEHADGHRYVYMIPASALVRNGAVSDCFESGRRVILLYPPGRPSKRPSKYAWTNDYLLDLHNPTQLRERVLAIFDEQLVFKDSSLSLDDVRQVQ